MHCGTIETSDQVLLFWQFDNMSKPQEQLQPSPSPEPSVFRDDAKKSDVHDKAIDLDQSSQGEESHVGAYKL